MSRRWQTWLVLMALVVRALIAPGFMLAPAAAADGLATIVICTPHGMKLLSVGPDGQPVQQNADDTSSAGSHCPFGAPPVAIIHDVPRIAAPRDLVGIRHHQPPTTALITYRARFRLARGPPPSLT
ncbi:MAG: DUF2946 family protein [Hyphomicrobiaceae bacterium]